MAAALVKVRREVMQDSVSQRHFKPQSGQHRGRPPDLQTSGAHANKYLCERA